MAKQVAADGVGCKNTVVSVQLVRLMYCFSFIIDGIITLPIALYGFLMFPDVPTTTKAFYLSEEVRPCR